MPIWGCDSCALLFQLYQPGLKHSRNSAAHEAKIAFTRNASRAVEVDKPIEGMLTWYQGILDSWLKDVTAAVGAA